MIPYYYRITRFEHTPGEFRVSPVSKSRSVDASPLHQELSTPSKSQPSPPLKQNYKHPSEDHEDFHLLEKQASPYPIVTQTGPWAYYAENHVKAQGSQIIVVLDQAASATQTLLWALLFSRYFDTHLSVISMVEIDFDNLLLSATRIYHTSGHSADLLKRKPDFQQIAAAQFTPYFLNQTAHQPTSLAIFTSEQAEAMSDILHGSHCPLLWIPRDYKLSEIRNILVPIENISKTIPVIQQALSLGQIFGSTIHIMHASPNKEAEIHEKYIFDQLSSLIQWQGVPHDQIITHGEAHTVIVDYAAKHEIDLIVMGTHHNLPGLQTSEAQSVISARQCPVFVLHPYKD